MKKITFLLIFLASYLNYGQEIASYSSFTGGGTATDPNVTVAGLTLNNINTFFSPISTYNWETSNTFVGNKSLEWEITPNASYMLNLTSLDISYFTFDSFFTGDLGPTSIEIHIDTGDGSGFNPIYTYSPATPLVQLNESIDLSAYSNIGNTVTFRLYAYGATDVSGNNFGGLLVTSIPANFGKGIIINGTVEPPCNGATITSWDGGAWDNGVPTINDVAVITGNYNTSGVGQGSITACSLVVNAGAVLNIANGDYIEIENDIVVDGTITVNPEAVVVQNSNSGLVTNNGTITVTKTTSPLRNWYEYTYWSSPVVNETVGVALTNSDTNRRFYFRGENFLDSMAENNNDNTLVAGQDDIDDNGDDWALAAGTDTMVPGVGYAATHSEAAFVGPPFSTPPYQFNYIYNGAFNNGVISVPIYRNDLETNDINWNLVGNPYPSAIDADLFLAANTPTDGAIYLWSQNTAPSSTNNGNEGANFSVSDYAIINSGGTLAGGDGLIPNRYIPSGQAFFISYSDIATPDAINGNVKQGTVIFNNSMRVTANNDQFFRTSNKKNSQPANRLWIDLTSDNGVFNQALIAYANGATDENDGMAYDAPRNLSSESAAVLYSIIEGETKKFAIQGKDPLTLDEDEIIQIGFKTTIETPTIYSLSIPQLEGDFLANNPVVVKDKLLNVSHNLKDQAYNFTSQAGEFNDRFEIVFNNAALSNDEFEVAENALSIVELKNGDVQFKLNHPQSMKVIEVIDLQGRVLYNIEVNGNNNTHRLSALSRAPFIAKVTLDNEQVIVKKAIKRY